MSTWKAVERSIASLLGGERVPITGRIRGSAPDVEHPWMSIEIKHRKGGLPKYILDSLDQAHKSAKQDQLPVAIWHKKGKKYTDSVIMMNLGDFIEHFGV